MGDASWSDTATLNLIFGARQFVIVSRAIRRASSHQYSFISEDFLPVPFPSSILFSRWDTRGHGASI